jgi:hypothetical protein
VGCAEEAEKSGRRDHVSRRMWARIR